MATRQRAVAMKSLQAGSTASQQLTPTEQIVNCTFLGWRKARCMAAVSARRPCSRRNTISLPASTWSANTVGFDN